MSLKINVDVKGIDGLKKQINFVDKMLKMKTDVEFQNFIKDKCLNEVKNYARERLYSSGTTNQEYYEDYINKIFTRDVKNGFEIVSNYTIDKPSSYHSDGYTFSISMAFEYGVGIIGQGSSDAPSSYRYNINNNFVKINGENVEGWWIPKSKQGNSVTFGENLKGNSVITQGYEGLEIFRFSREKITQKLKTWVNEYFSSKK